MEIIQIDKCGISDDIIKYKFKEWILFHKNNNIVDINNFEIIQNTLQKSIRPSFQNGKFIEIEIDEIIDTNNYENINFDKDINTICNDIFCNYCINKYENEFINYIFYNKQLVGLALIDNDFGSVGAEYVFITDLLLSNSCDWYNIIYNIIMFYNNENKYEMIYINFNHYMDHHLIINDIMNILNIPYIKKDYKQKNYYVFKLKNYNYTYTNKFNINIIGYKHATKTEKDLLFNHTSNIGILFNAREKWENPVFNRYKTPINLQDIMHNVSVYDIILEKPIIINNQIDDIFIDIEINLKNHKFKLNSDQPYNLRLNKLFKKYTYSLIGYNYIYSIRCYYNDCKCKDCRKQYDLLIKDYKPITKNEETYKEWSNQYYYNYYIDYDTLSATKSNFILYNFIHNNFSYNRKQYDNFNYNKIIINKPDRQLNLEKLNILDLSYIFNNNIIEEIKNIDEIKENKKTKNIPNDTSISQNNNISNTEYNYIYLIQKYDVNLKQDLYKFGKTKRHFNERIKEHGIEGKVLIILDVENCNIIETNILKVLRNDTKINERKDRGNEYFYCDNKQYIINLILTNIYL
jgi:hypothetical protein